MSQPDRERWQMVQQLVDDALDLPAGERKAFLQKATAGDQELHQDAASLLASCERALRSDVLLAQSAAVFAAPLVNAYAGERVSAAVHAASQGRYQIEGQLARGGMATVYAARDQRHDRRVAVKVFEHHVHTSGVDRFLREIRTTARLTHPHLLGLHDSGEAEGFLFYVMPYVDGETLRARMARAGGLPIAEAVRLIREIADALAYAHEHALVHRDLKPENVLLSNGHAMVADFGIAKALAAAGNDGTAAPIAEGDPHATFAGSLLGTPAYMAPEQADSASVVDQRVDLYALGVIAYEMLAGKHPFGARGAQAMIDAHRTEAPAKLTVVRPETPVWLAELVGRLMAKDPAQRPQSADEITRRIDTANAIQEPLERTRRRRAMVLTAGVVLSLSAIVVSWLRTATTRDSASIVNAAPAEIDVPIKTVAVLPFTDASRRTDDRYFSEGLTDELALALARLPGLRVAGRTSTFAFRGRDASAQEIGRVLDVGALVTGATRRANGRVRVSIQLVNAADGRVLWGSVYESKSNDVFRIQDEFTRAVVTALAPSLGDGAQNNTLQSSRGTTDQEAYDLYLRGRYYWLERGRDNVAKSIQQLREAVERDPGFARAHAALSLSYGTYPSYVPDAIDSMTAVIAFHARRAVALDSSFADAQLAIGQVLEAEFRYEEALRHYQRALALEPSNATVHHWLGTFLVSLGRTDDGVALLRRGAILDPLAKSLGSAYSVALLFARRVPEAKAAARAVLAIDSMFPLPYWTLALAAGMEGRTDEAVQNVLHRQHLAPEMGGSELALLYAYAMGGRWEEADRVRSQIKRPTEKAVAALIYGDREPLLRLLATAPGKREWINLNLVFGCHPYLDPLWTEARFIAEMGRLGVAPCKLARPWSFRPPASEQRAADSV